MEFFHIKHSLPFMRFKLIWNIISLVAFLLAVGCLCVRGLNLSVEFTGGTTIEVMYPQAADTDKIRSSLEAALGVETQVQNVGSARDVSIRLPNKIGTDSSKLSAQVMDILHKDDASATLKSADYVGPQVGSELATDGATALILVVIGIVVYLALRFEWKFAVATIIANMHDVVLVLGIFSFTQWEFSLPVLAAVMAVLGYSVNESVIIFDRVREFFRKFRRISAEETVNMSITATLSRTAMTHGSTLATTIAMLLFGGPALHYFAMALTIGICFGIYSSIFVSVAIALYLGASREDMVKTVKKDEVQEMVP